MSKVENFKNFVKQNPALIKYVNKGEMTWQKFYEMYDLYGEEETIWSDYLTIKEEKQENKTTTKNSSYRLEDFFNMAKNIDVNKVQDGLTSLQKTLSLFGDLFINKDVTKTNTYNPRPLYRKFED